MENLEVKTPILKNKERKFKRKEPRFVEIKENENPKKQKNVRNLTKEQEEIIQLKSQLLSEKVKNVGDKNPNFITKRRPRRFRDTQYDGNATTKSILKGAAFMAFTFGMIILLILIMS